ncbi:hypothetical protein [Leucobacter sp. NPDC077196]|uniref:hypothetical protein n=1 Tax=Leucobacter sp. NPDC077196 TaxID=3154959 RepID=UPI003424827B
MTEPQSDIDVTKPSKISLREVVFASGGLFVGACGVGIGAAVSTAYWPAAGQYFRDFFLSPALASFGAVVAACIAFGGLRMQSKVSQKSIETTKAIAEADLTHQKETNQFTREREATLAEETSWWRSFDWISGQAITPDPNGLTLDRRLLFSAAQKLASDLSDDQSVRGFALSSVADALSRPVETTDAPQDESDLESTADSPNTDVQQWTPATVAALRSYVNATRGSSSESAVAEAALYEEEILGALSARYEMFDSESRPSMRRVRRGPVDAQVIFPSKKRVGICIKGYDPGSKNAFYKLLSVAKQMDARFTTERAVVLVSPVDVPVEKSIVGRVVIVKWARATDTDFLIDTISRLGRYSTA